jgi:hypothetical protein
VKSGRVDFRAVEVTERVDSCVVGEVDCVSGGRISGETRVFEHSSVENEFEHVGICSVPRVGFVVGFLAEAVICDVRAKIGVEWVVGAVSEEV